MQNEDWGRPKISLGDVHREIRRRAGVPEEVSKAVFKAYERIIKESLIAGVEVPLLGLGRLTWRVIPPKNSQKMFGVVRHGVDGYNRTTIRFSRGWLNEFRDATRVPYADSTMDDDEDSEVNSDG